MMRLFHRFLLWHGGLPDYPGKWRISHLLSSNFSASYRYRGQIVRNGLLFNIDCHNHVDYCLTYFGSYESNEIRCLQKLISPGHCVFDVGANVGYHALVFAKLVGTTGEIHSFEPFPKTFDRLQTNIKLNNISWIHAWKLGLGNHDGITIGINQSGNNPGAFFLMNPVHMTAKGIKVEITKIDTFIARHQIRAPDLIKIDVEGYEVAVLKGGQRTIERHHPVIMVECNPIALARQQSTPEELFSIMIRNGYDLFLPSKKHLLIRQLNI